MKNNNLGAVIALSLGLATGCCTDSAVTQEAKPRVPLYEQESLLSRLHRIEESVYCIRVQQPYEGSENGKSARDFHGAGFAFLKRGEWTYISSVAHVIVDLPMFADQSDSETDQKTILWKPVGEPKIFIVENKMDRKRQDDIPLELFYIDREHDAAVFRTKAHVPVPYGAFELDKKLQAMSGDEVYAIGYIFGAERAVGHGIVANPYTELPIFDLNVAKGFSGGPIFINRGGTLYWAGNTSAVMADTEYVIPVQVGYSRAFWLRDFYNDLEAMILQEDGMKGYTKPGLKK